MRKPKEIKWRPIKGKSYELEVPYPDPENDVKAVGGFRREYPAVQRLTIKTIENKLRVDFTYADRAYFTDRYELHSTESVSFKGVRFQAGGNGIAFESTDQPKKSILTVKEQMLSSPGLPEKEQGLLKKLLEALEKQKRK